MSGFVNGKVLDSVGLGKIFNLLKNKYYINGHERLNVYKIIDSSKVGTSKPFPHGNLLIINKNISFDFKTSFVNGLIFNYSENDVNITLPAKNTFKYEGDITYLDNNIFHMPGNSLLDIKMVKIGSENFVLLELKKYQKL